MKWYTALFLAAALVALFGLPFAEYDTAALLPLRVLQVEKTSAGVRIVGDIGETGCGADFSAAADDLRARAAGTVLFDTAEQVVLCDESLAREVALSGALRPSTMVYFSKTVLIRDNISAYLSAHRSDLTVADLAARYA